MGWVGGPKHYVFTPTQIEVELRLSWLWQLFLKWFIPIAINIENTSSYFCTLADGRRGYFPFLWQNAVYSLRLLINLCKMKWWWVFGMEFSIFLNLPSQQKTCSHTIKLASGNLTARASGLYSCLHSGLLKAELNSCNLMLIMIDKTLWFFKWRGSISLLTPSHTSEYLPSKGSLSLSSLSLSKLHLDMKYKLMICHFLQKNPRFTNMLSYDRYISLHNSWSIDFKVSRRNLIVNVATWNCSGIEVFKKVFNKDALNMQYVPVWGILICKVVQKCLCGHQHGQFQISRGCTVSGALYFQCLWIQQSK